MKSLVRWLFGKLDVARAGVRGGENDLSRVVRPRRELSPEGLRRLILACQDLADGDCCTPLIYQLIDDEMRARRVASGTEFGPDNPRVSGLMVKRSGLPDWWSEGGNLLLVAADVSASVSVKMGFLLPPPTGSVAIIGAGSIAGEWALSGEQGLFVLGDQSVLPVAVTTIREGSTVLIGEHANAISPIAITAMNRGIVVVGPESLWAGGVIVITDDFHAIRDRLSGQRVNVYGGRVVVDRHVWMAIHASLLGDCFVGHDSVVGMGAIVRNVAMPSHCVCAGRPAKVVRENIVWSIDDLP